MDVSTQAELEAALLVGGDIWCADTLIPLTDTMHVDVTARIHGGRFTRAHGAAFYVTANNVEFDRVTITGGGRTYSHVSAETSDYDGLATYATYDDVRWAGGGYDANEKLIWVRGTRAVPVTGLRIHDCTVTHSLADSMWLEWCEDAHIHHNTIRQALYSGILVISGNRIDISHNLVTDVELPPGKSNVYGIACTDLSGDISDRSRNITITANHVSLVDWEGIETHGGECITVVGNRVTGCPRGIAFITGNSTRTFVPSRCLATGNTIDAAGLRRPLREGISLSGLSGNGATGLISGNQVIGYTNPIWTNYWSPGLSLVDGNVTT